MDGNMYSVKHHSLFQKSLEMLILFFILSIAYADSPKSYDVSGPLNEPKIFAEGVISTGDYDSHPAFSPDGNTLYFVKMGPDLSKWTIFVSKFQTGKWSNPEIAAFSGHYWDADPFFDKDGNTLYFISSRPLKEGGPPKDFDIWKVEKTSGFKNAVHLESPINSEASEYYPTLTDNGTMYFGSRRKDGKGKSDIWMSRFSNEKYS